MEEWEGGGREASVGRGKDRGEKGLQEVGGDKGIEEERKGKMDGKGRGIQQETGRKKEEERKDGMGKDNRRTRKGRKKKDKKVKVAHTIIIFISNHKHICMYSSVTFAGLVQLTDVPMVTNKHTITVYAPIEP